MYFILHTFSESVDQEKVRCVCSCNDVSLLVRLSIICFVFVITNLILDWWRHSIRLSSSVSYTLSLCLDSVSSIYMRFFYSIVFFSFSFSLLIFIVCLLMEYSQCHPSLRFVFFDPKSDCVLSALLMLILSHRHYLCLNQLLLAESINQASVDSSAQSVCTQRNRTKQW